MPTSTGGPTIDEELDEARASLAKVRQALDRHAVNGRVFDIGGSTVTQASFESLERRERSLTRRIQSLEARRAGVHPVGSAVTQSSNPTA